MNFTLVTYMRLHEALEFAASKKREEDVKPTQSIDFFLRNLERGSKPYRCILQHKEINRWKIENLNTAKTFFEIMDMPKPDNDILKFCWGEWNRGYFNNRCREFIFKFRNNTLGLNSRVCKFVPRLMRSVIYVWLVVNQGLYRLSRSYMFSFTVLTAANIERWLRKNYSQNYAMLLNLIAKNFGWWQSYRVWIKITRSCPLL